MCRNFKSGNRCIHGSNCLYRHADGEEKPGKKSMSESTQGAVAIQKENKIQGCVSQVQIQRSLFSGKLGERDRTLRQGHAIKFTGRTWYEVQIRERKGPSRGVIQKR